MYTKALLATILWALLPAAQAAHTPARLLEGDRSLEALIKVPKKMKTGLHKVYCEAQVNTAGRPNSFYCYALGNSAPGPLVRAVERAGALARFAPATRNGVPADVYMLLMVRVYVPMEGEPLVLAVPNNGIEEERYGPFYTAPQRFNSFYWGRHVTEVSGDRHTVVWQRLKIDEHGKVTEWGVTGLVGSQADRRIIEEQLKSMEFMPGFVNGKPVPMSYAEPAVSMTW
jgi:hypothetical protein